MSNTSLALFKKRDKIGYLLFSYFNMIRIIELETGVFVSQNQIREGYTYKIYAK